VHDRITRRTALLTLAGVLDLAANACSHPRSVSSAASGSIDALTEGAGQLSMLGPSATVNPGPQPFAFFLVDGRSVLADANASVWFAKDPAGNATGPVEAHWYPMRGCDLHEEATRPDALHLAGRCLEERQANGCVIRDASPLPKPDMRSGGGRTAPRVRKVRTGKANFIHVEDFLRGRDLKPPPATAQHLSPAFKAWGFQDEPWVIVIDGQGVSRGRLGPGVTAAPLIEAALRPIL
jgi:hypothetical protein